MTVKHLCEKAGISGHKTNHSLTVATATRLLHSGMDEQLITWRELAIDVVVESKLINDQASSSRRWFEMVK